jgi:hypothetical protein
MHAEMGICLGFIINSGKARGGREGWVVNPNVWEAYRIETRLLGKNQDRAMDPSSPRRTGREPVGPIAVMPSLKGGTDWSKQLIIGD